jgi:hypothetical protein
VVLETFDNAFLAGNCSGQQGGKADDVSVEFLDFQRRIVEGDIDAEIKNLKAAGREHGAHQGLADSVDVAFHCAEDNFAECLACRAHLVRLRLSSLRREVQAWKKHLALLELFATRTQSENRAAIDGLEWVDAFVAGALARIPRLDQDRPQRWIASSIRKAYPA